MFIIKIIRSVLYPGWALFSAFIILLSGLINGGDITCSPNAELIRTDKFTLDEALLMSQGITTDGVQRFNQSVQHGFAYSKEKGYGNHKGP